MKVVSGVLYTKDEHAAQQFRTMFWDWLTEQHTNVNDYWHGAGFDPNYIFYFKWVPRTRFSLYRNLWIGPNAVYPHRATGTFSHRDYFNGRDMDPYFVEAMKFARAHKPCVVVVESMAALEMAHDHLSTYGSTYLALASLPETSIKEALRSFDRDSKRESWLIITKPVATHGWRLSRTGVSVAASCLLDQRETEQVMGRTARMIQPLGRVEVIQSSYINQKE